MKIRFGRPSPAMVVAVVALVAALSGSAYAALGKNSVGTRQLKAKAVTAGKIANNAVTSAKVATELAHRLRHQPHRARHGADRDQRRPTPATPTRSAATRRPARAARP